jgi:hypothetical protein
VAVAQSVNLPIGQWPYQSLCPRLSTQELGKTDSAAEITQRSHYGSVISNSTWRVRRPHALHGRVPALSVQLAKLNPINLIPSRCPVLERIYILQCDFTRRSSQAGPRTKKRLYRVDFRKYLNLVDSETSERTRLGAGKARGRYGPTRSDGYQRL